MLLLDLREEEEFEKCHIEGAVHYPAPMLSRSVNPFIPQIYEFVRFLIITIFPRLRKRRRRISKYHFIYCIVIIRSTKPLPSSPSLISTNNAQRNRDGKIIVLYDMDEKISVPAGNQFFEKGFDNVCILSGGLREFAEQFRESVTGLPPSPRAFSVSGMSSSSSSARRSSLTSVSSVAPSVARSTASTARTYQTESMTNSKPWK